MYDPKDCNDLNELRTEVLQQRDITKNLQTDYHQLREQLNAAQQVITEYRQENDAQKQTIHELAERARIAEALNVQGNINFQRLQKHHKIIRDGWMQATSMQPDMQVLIVERKGPNSLVVRKCDYPGALTEIQAILLYSADFAIDRVHAPHTTNWHIHGKELRIYHDAKDTAHYYQVTICAKEEKEN